AKVYYETQRSAPPAFASRKIPQQFNSLATFPYNPHSWADPGTTKHKMVREESGITLMPEFHLGVQCRGGCTLSDSCPRDTGCSPQTRGIANLTVAAGKIPISRTTRARLFMKHGFSAHPRLPAPDNFTK
ncbi:MAG: hypothetical protein V5B78_11815, partial [Desulfohalobiaceae bacterium]